MSRSLGAARKQDETSLCSRQIVGSSVGAANVFLTLPSVSARVPVASTSTKMAQVWAEIALLVMDLVDEKELVVGKNVEPRDVVTQAISLWASKHCSNISVLGGFDLHVSLESSDLNLYDYDNGFKQRSWFVGLCSSQSENYFGVKAAVEALEAAFPGLGHTAVKVAELASYKTVTMFTPEVGFYHGQHIYWYGADNDEEFKSEFGAFYDGDEEEGGDEGDMFKPSDYLKSFPDFFFSGSEMTTEQLQEIAKCDSGNGEVARTILSIKQLIDDGARLPGLQDTDVEQVYFSGYMGWDDNDSLSRCLDDFMNMANQCSDGYTELFGVTAVPFNKRAFQKWRAKMEKGFELYSNLDRLMQLIGTVR